MELKHLRHFVAVVDCGTLSGASSILHLTQPALTRSIKTLEHQLEAELLERRARGVVPTEAGARLYTRAKTILNEAARTAEDVSATARGARGKLSIGVAAMFSGEVIAAVLAHLKKAAPDLTVHVLEGFFEDLVDNLKTAQVEAVFTNFPPGLTDPELTFEPIITVQSRFVVSAKHPLASNKHVSMSEIAKVQMALVRQAHMTTLVSELFAAQDVGLSRPAIETNALQLLRSLVLSGDYISLLPDHILEDDVEAGRIVRLNVEGTPLQRASGLVLRNQETQRPAVSHFAAAARAALADWPEIKS